MSASSDKPEKEFIIAVSDASSPIGYAAMVALTAPNVAVQIKIRAVVPNESAKAQMAEFKNADVVVCDAASFKNTLSDAFKGVHTIIIATPDDRREQITKHYIAGAKAAHVKQAIVISSALCGNEKYQSGKEYAAIEEAWKGSTIGYTLLRLPQLLDVELFANAESVKNSGIITAPIKPDDKFVYLCNIDAGRALKSSAFHYHYHNNKTHTPVNQLEPIQLTGTELAKIYSEILGKPVEFKQVPPAEYHSGLIKSGLTKGKADLICDIWAAIAEGGESVVNTLTHDYSRITGLHSIDAKRFIQINKVKFGAPEDPKPAPATADTSKSETNGANGANATSTAPESATTSS